MRPTRLQRESTHSRASIHLEKALSYGNLCYVKLENQLSFGEGSIRRERLEFCIDSKHLGGKVGDVLTFIKGDGVKALGGVAGTLNYLEESQEVGRFLPLMPPHHMNPFCSLITSLEPVDSIPPLTSNGYRFTVALYTTATYRPRGFELSSSESSRKPCFKNSQRLRLSSASIGRYERSRVVPDKGGIERSNCEDNEGKQGKRKLRGARCKMQREWARGRRRARRV